MGNNSFDINEIIIRYLDESASETEIQYLSDWIDQSDSNKKWFLETRDLWLSCISDSDDKQTEQALNKLKERICSNEEKDKTLRFKYYSSYLLRIAAILLLAVGVSYFFLKYSSFFKRHTVMEELVSVEKQKEPFTLPDGSRVWLNVNSKLIYPEKFAHNMREVQLEGGAFFDVINNKQSPFHIRLDNMVVEVLGTQLDISNYKDTEILQTVLVKGSIQITGIQLKEPVLLRPDEKFTYSKIDNKAKIEKVDAQDYISWRDKELIFDNESLSNIIINLERWYGVKIECGSTLDKRIRLSFTVKEESLEDILQVMTLVAPIRYKQESDKIILIPK